MPEHEGPLTVISRFPEWQFEMALVERTDQARVHIVAGRRGEQRVILAVDRWDDLAARTLIEMVHQAEA